MKHRREKLWTALFAAVFFLGVSGAVWAVAWVDPFFHFHAPRTGEYFYTLDNQRSQNDGITRHFEYTGLITGTSVTKNFRASQAEELFGGRFIKIAYDGASYREVNEAVTRALERNPELRTVIRGLDLEYILAPRDEMWSADLTLRPVYLYDEDPLNDVHYVLNRDILFSRVIPMMIDRGKSGFRPGITDFDRYDRWRLSPDWFGPGAVLPDGLEELVPGEPVHLTAEQAEEVRASVRQNLTDAADRYPETEFYCFIPPDCMGWWYRKVEDGSVYAIVEAERVMMEEIFRHPNVRLYSWNDRTDLLGNLDNYTDTVHFGEWVNEWILTAMKDGDGLVTRENCEALLARELDGFLHFDYQGMLN